MLNYFRTHRNNWLIKGTKSGFLQQVKFLVKMGADIHSENDDALRTSVSREYLEIVKFLVGVGTNIYAQNNHALLRSSQKGHLEIVKFLVGQDANINAWET